MGGASREVALGLALQPGHSLLKVLDHEVHLSLGGATAHAEPECVPGHVEGDATAQQHRGWPAGRHTSIRGRGGDMGGHGGIWGRDMGEGTAHLVSAGSAPRRCTLSSLALPPRVLWGWVLPKVGRPDSLPQERSLVATVSGKTSPGVQASRSHVHTHIHT